MSSQPSSSKVTMRPAHFAATRLRSHWAMSEANRGSRAVKVLRAMVERQRTAGQTTRHLDAAQAAGGHAAARTARLFEDAHVVSAIDQSPGRRQSGDTCANHGDLHRPESTLPRLP